MNFNNNTKNKEIMDDFFNSSTNQPKSILKSKVDNPV